MELNQDLKQRIEGRVQALKLKGKFSDVRQWANNRGLIEGGSVMTQKVKLFEEFGELCRAVIKNDVKELKDAIGDCIVVIINMYAISEVDVENWIKYNEQILDSYENKPINIINSLISSMLELSYKDRTCNGRHYIEDVLTTLAQLTIHYDTNLVECLDLAYNEIKDRKGKMSAYGSFIKNE